MGQKVHPYGFRLGYNKTWRSRWFADADYAKLLHEDLRLRKALKTRLSHAGVAEIDIERTANKIRVNIFSARPGIIIGRKGAEVDKLGAELRAVYGQDIHINIQLVRRITFRRAMRRSMENALRFGAQGVKIRCSGRLNGAEIARSEWYQEGRLPLHTLKADIEYGFAEAFTTYGAIGVKVWIYKGELHRSKAHRRAL